MSKELLVGASGFIGRHLNARLSTEGVDVIAPSSQDLDLADLDQASLGDWFGGIDVVTVCAGLAHGDHPTDRLEQVNSVAPARLLEAAASAGVADFIWLSSARVLGASSDAFLAEGARASPGDAYARSKWAGEQALRAVQVANAPRLHIVRPPLVYGAGVGGNMATLQRAVRGRVPLPVANVRARRSMVSVDNLVDFVRQLPGQPSGTWHVADAELLTLGEVVSALAEGCARHAAVLRCPPSLLSAALLVGGQRRVREVLLRSFLLDCSKASRELGWTPPQRAREALAASMVQSC